MAKSTSLMESKTQRTKQLDDAFKQITTIDPEDLEPQVSASMTTKNGHTK